MGWALYGSLALTVGSLVHLHTIQIEEPAPAPRTGEREPFVDIAAAVEAIRAVPGLAMLIALSAFNNLIGGVFMALMDAYGLELAPRDRKCGVSVQGVSVRVYLGGCIP